MQTAFNNKLYPDYSQSGISPVTQDILSNTSAPETDEEDQKILSQFCQIHLYIQYLRSMQIEEKKSLFANATKT